MCSVARVADFSDETGLASLQFLPEIRYTVLSHNASFAKRPAVDLAAGVPLATARQDTTWPR
jgi:hypothetical protein